MSKPYNPFPVLPVIMPADLRNQVNGRLDEKLLKPVAGYPKGRLHWRAATAYSCMHFAALVDGITLKPTSTVDCYRSYARQEAAFNDRYSATPTWRKPEVTRTWQGQTYWLKTGKAPSAVPGTSNHGWGLAVDIANASGKRLAWLMGTNAYTSKALLYGFTWEVASGPNAEPWHIRYVCGDNYTQAVKDLLKKVPELEVTRDGNGPNLP